MPAKACSEARASRAHFVALAFPPRVSALLAPSALRVLRPLKRLLLPARTSPSISADRAAQMVSSTLRPRQRAAPLVRPEDRMLRRVVLPEYAQECCPIS